MYHSNDNYQVMLNADKVKPFLDKRPQNVVALLPYRYKADTITSQGVAITGAEDIQTPALNGSVVKAGMTGLVLTPRPQMNSLRD